MMCKECLNFKKGYCLRYNKKIILSDWNKNKRCFTETEINKTEKEVLKNG